VVGSLYFTLDEIAKALDVDVEDVQAVAFVELSNDEWDEDMERVTAGGRLRLMEHFFGGVDPE
jgi:hypothetical protein